MGIGRGPGRLARQRAGDAALSTASGRRRRASQRGLRISAPRLDFIAPGRARGFAGAAGLGARANLRPGLFALAFALAFALPPGLRAQDALAQACPVPPTANAYNSCLTVAQSALIAQARLALAAAGGAPLLGNASTLGMRLGSTPRVAVQLRASGARLTVPAAGAGNGQSSLASSFDADGAVALYQGLSPAPTLGGVGALDLLGSLGVVSGGGAPLQGSPATFGIGARLGILRESFTVPGVTLSAMLRRTGSLTAIGPDSARAHFSHIADVALRATVGKRLFPLNTLVGVGLDRTSGDVMISAPPCTGTCTLVGINPITAPLTQTRANFFADLTWTALVFNATAEVGWQRGGSPAASAFPTGYESLVRKGGLFGSLGLRLTI